MQKFKRDVVENEASVAFVVVMSHGEDDCVQMDDLELLDAYEKFVYAFASDDAVHAIPKIFLFNMCRPWSSTPKFQTDSARHAEQFTYNVKNTIIIFSTIRHEPSLRDQYTGSLYISQFVKTVEKQYKQKSLNDMLFDVSSRTLSSFSVIHTRSLIMLFQFCSGLCSSTERIRPDTLL